LVADPEVWSVVLSPSGVPRRSMRVEVTLWVDSSSLTPGEGEIDPERLVIAGAWKAHTDRTGRWAVRLRRQVEIDPPGTFYRVREWPDGTRGDPVIFDFIVPTGAEDSYWVRDLMTSPV
jgi:hypothetical protein